MNLSEIQCTQGVKETISMIILEKFSNKLLKIRLKPSNKSYY